ncbi:hypothetical protein BGW37DRAFT_530408 [Umbelopsis sp. PMI_123]|nr:hypothetical protein BGW37DRAFT_530408 [Umbelopsis sp. PMI_123]
MARSTFSKLFQRNGGSKPVEPEESSPTTENVKFKLRPYSIYFSAMIFNSDGHILLTPSGHIPTVPVILDDQALYDTFDDTSTEFSWAVKTSMDWADHEDAEVSTTDSRSSCSDEGIGTSDESMKSHGSSSDEAMSPVNCNFSMDDSRTTLQFREGVLTAASQLRKHTGCHQLGIFYDKVVEFRRQLIKMIVTVQYCPKKLEGPFGCTSYPKSLQSLRWSPQERINSLYEEPQQNSEVWFRSQAIYTARRAILNPGLYLGVFHVQSTPRGLGILVDKRHKNLLPCARIRSETNMTSDEWKWIQMQAEKDINTEDGIAFLKNSASVERKKTVLEIERKVATFASSVRQAKSMLSKSTGVDIQMSDIFAEDTITITKTKGDDKGNFQYATLSADATFVSEYLKHQEQSLQYNENGNGIISISDMIMKENENKVVDHSSEVPIRIIVIIKPMSTVAHDVEKNVNSGYKFYPFPLFDILHHSCYNATVYNPLRRSMLHLQNVYTAIRLHCEAGNDIGFLDNSSTISEQSCFFTDSSTSQASRKLASSICTTATTRQKRNCALSNLALDMTKLTNKWLQISWTYRMIAFDRKRLLNQATVECTSNLLSTRDGRSLGSHLQAPCSLARTNSTAIKSLEVASSLSHTLTS